MIDDDVGRLFNQGETFVNNASMVKVRTNITEDLHVDLIVPKATSGAIEKGPEKTKLSSAAGSWKSGQVSLITVLEGSQKDSGSLGPGTFAVIDNVTGALVPQFEAVDFQIIKRATSLTSELSSLAVSNFFGYEEP